MAAATTMKDDIEMGVRFILSITKNNIWLNKAQLDHFGKCLNRIVCERFTGHWYPERPSKGQAYRCTLINRSDPVGSSLIKVCQESGIEYRELSLPREFSLWIDTGDVSCRLSESSHPFQVSEEYRSGKSSPEPETSDYHSASQAPSSSSSSDDEGWAKQLGQAQALHRSQPGPSHVQQVVQYYYVPSHLWIPWQQHTVTFLLAY